jgi:hypothetical protein
MHLSGIGLFLQLTKKRVIVDVLVHGLRIPHEKALKRFASPLDRMLDSIRKVFKSAHRDRLLGRILRAAVGLRKIRDDDLGVSLRAKSPAFQ